MVVMMFMSPMTRFAKQIDVKIAELSNPEYVSRGNATSRRDIGAGSNNKKKCQWRRSSPPAGRIVND